jgi:hypothetical protein
VLSSVWRGLALAALLGAAALSAPAEDPPAKKADKAAPAADKKAAEAEAVGEALRTGAGAVILTAEEEQRRNEELARLKARNAELEGQLRGRPAAAPPPKAPGACRLSGEVKGNLARLRAAFDFATERPDTTVLLGCNQARATGGSFEGRTPQLGQQKAEGFTVLVKGPGTHQLTLEMELALESQGGDTGFTLSFPPIPIFHIDLELPPGAKDLRVNKRPLSECPFLKLIDKRLVGGPGLGSVDRLEVTWKDGRAAAGNPLRSADGPVQVRVGRELTTVAKLTLRAEGGPVKDWQLLLPPKAELHVAPADEDRVAGIDAADRPFASLRTVRLKEPSSAPLTVHVTARGPVPRAGVAAVGPLFVLGATHQTGTLLVRKADPELHLTLQPRGDLTRRAPTEEERRDPGLEAAFNYHFWNVAPPDKPAGTTGAGSLSWLDVEAEEVRGQVRSKVKHELALKPAPDESRRLTWYATTEITVTPRWADADYLEVKLPAGWEDLDDGRGPGTAARTVRLRLSRAGDGGPRTYTLTLRGRYPAAGGASSDGPVSLPLPKPQGTLDQGGEVTVRVPADTELLPLPPPAGLEPGKQSLHEQTWPAPVRAPERVEVSWRPYRPAVRATAVADLTLGPRQGLLRHEIEFDFTQPTPPREVTLRVPAAAADSLRVAEGGALAPAGNGSAGTRAVSLSGASGRKHRLVLEYAFDLPSAQGDGRDPRADLSVSLVAPEGVTQGEVKLRVWAEPGVLPLLAAPGWTELRVEEVPGDDRLPALVARAGRIDRPVKLRFGERAAAFTVLVERALIQARVPDAGGQTYRAAFRLERLAAGTLDVELPAPVPTLQLRVRLDGRDVPRETVDEEGNRAEVGRVARLKVEPALVRSGSVLEVIYQLPPGRAGNSALQTVLLPPVLRGGPGHVPTRWQLTVPAGWVTVGPEGGPGSERTWGLRGWLLAPHLALAPADLEAWLTGAGPLPEEGGPAPPPSLACWRTDLGPLTLVHAPQLAWLLACSLGLVVLCLGLYELTRPAEGQALSATWFWPALTLVALGAVVAGLLWPTALGAVVYGCEPGALVLVLVAAFQWLLHERYRRRVVFLPSFSRGRAGSSLLRGSSQRPAGEPSTVDAPPRAGGSSAGKAESRTSQ